MGLLRDTDRKQLQAELGKMQNPVKLVFFTQATDCDYCEITKQVLEELVPLSDKIHLQTYDFATDKPAAAQYKIARVPAIAILRLEPPAVLVAGNESPRERDYGIRYYGVPAGFEFASLVGDIMDVSLGESGLSEASKATLKQLQAPVHLQVFATPT